MAETSASAPQPASATIALAALGGFLTIFGLASLADFTRAPLLLGSFGASCVLVFGFPEAPFARPRNVIGGHVLASFIALACKDVFGLHPWSMALAVALALAAMMATRTAHPPAGSNPVIVFLSGAPWSFLFAPTLVGATLIVVVGVLYKEALRHPGRLWGWRRRSLKSEA